MSVVEPSGHLGGLDLADRCNTPVLADLLDERDLLGHGPLLDGTLTERDTDRVRVAKFIAAHPEGTPLSHVVSYAVKGSRQTPASASKAPIQITSSCIASSTTS